MEEAFSIMLVGMITVFIILWLVVIIGNVLIRLTNRFQATGMQAQNSMPDKGLYGKGAKIAAIAAAVEAVSRGRAKITKITKL